MKRLAYLVVLHKSPTSDWGASVADLPGCVAVAKTLDGALRRIHVALEMHHSAMREDGQRVPRPRLRAVKPRHIRSGSEFYALVEITA